MIRLFAALIVALVPLAAAAAMAGIGAAGSARPGMAFLPDGPTWAMLIVGGALVVFASRWRRRNITPRFAAQF